MDRDTSLAGIDKVKHTLLKTGLFLLMTLFVFIMCAGEEERGGEFPGAYFIRGSAEEKEALGELFMLLREEPEAGWQQFSLVREIANEYSRINDYGRLINFLTIWTNQHPQDPYNAYYIFMVGYAYLRQEAAPVAALYFDRIVKNYPDLIVKGESIHLICLNQLINLVDNPEQKISYYEELISGFADKIDLGITWFMLAQTYEQVGEWNRAISAYTQFLPFYGTVIPGFPDAYSYAKRLVDFNNSPKNWTFESLPALIETIESALDAGNTRRLWQYRAQVNFFASSWAQQGGDDAGMSEFNLSSFSTSSKLRYADSLSPGSNANEAYLRTWGWSQFTSIWYFYFRKIYFPLDPEIHGRWEWAGIYYGEKF
jgi:hypothetical protein